MIEDQDDAQILFAQWNCERMEAIIDIPTRALESRLTHLENLGDEAEYGGFDVPRRVPEGQWGSQNVGIYNPAVCQSVGVEIDKELRDLLRDG